MQVIQIVFNWVDANKAWLFDGLGALSVIALLTWLFSRLSNRRNTQQDSQKPSVEVAGNNSNPAIHGSNIAGRDININILGKNEGAVPNELHAKNATGAAIARRLYSLFYQFTENFEKESLSFEKEGDLPTTTELFKQIETTAVELEPFIESGPEIRECLYMISRTLSFYRTEISQYRSALEVIRRDDTMGRWFPLHAAQFNNAMERVTGDGRQRRLDTIQEQLERLKTILSAYIKANTL